MADVFQLAHIAWKLELTQLVHGRIRNALGLHAQLLRTALQKVAGQHGHVFAALTQCRQAQADHIQAVVQVFAEHAFLDALLQVLVGRSDHAHIGFDSAVATHAVEMAIRQDAQQTGLQIERHVPDFIEEQGATVGLLKASATRCLRTGEGSTLMTEQLALQQILGDGCRVNGHKGLVGAGRVLVQRVRYQFLARARLTRDQHGDMALRETANASEHILHGRCLAEHLGGIDHLLLGHVLALALVHSAADQLNRLGQIKGLGQVLERTALKRRHRTVQVRKGRHDDDGQTGQALLDGAQQIEA